MPSEEQSKLAFDEQPNMTSEEQPKRQLIKGPLKPPRPRPPGASYTQKRASKDEVTVALGYKRRRQDSTEGTCLRLTNMGDAAEYKTINLAGPMPQPFVNPDDGDLFAPLSPKDL